MPNHMTKMANIVEKGTAPEERLPQMKKFKKKPTPKTIAGYNVAVWNDDLPKDSASCIFNVLERPFVSNLSLWLSCKFVQRKNRQSNWEQRDRMSDEDERKDVTPWTRRENTPL